MPELSVITINLNNRDGLEKTILSVIEQTYTDIEYIVIDGSSTDGSVNVVQKYSTNISAWISETDTGIYNAMNKGLHVAKGKYCLFLNSGDSLVNKEIIAKVFSKNRLDDILYGDLVFDYGNNRMEIAGLPEKLDLVYLFNDNIWHPAAFIKRALLFQAGGYNEKYKIAGDYDFFFSAIAIKKVTCRHLPFPITVYDRKGISSLPENMSQILAERSAIHKSYLSEKEITVLNNLKKFKNPGLSRRLINKMKTTWVANFIHRLFRSIL